MGQVYRATDTKLNRQVALKILPEAFASDPDRLARFQREAQVLASLNHPNIAAIHGLEDSEGTKALVLELVEGPTLADRISKGPIPVDEALPIAKQIAEALEAAHEAGVIHRDLKPANIKVREDGTVKVLDFGLAKALDPTPEGDASQSPTLTAAATQMGVIIGTAAYMSPEQARGKQVDKRADIWAFGVVLFEMLTGQRPFEGRDVSETLAAVMMKEPEWPALPTSVPAPLGRLLRRCLEREPKDRLRDIGDARVELRDVHETPPPSGADTTAPASVAQPAGWRQALPWALGTLIMGSLVTGLVVWSLRPEPPRASPERWVVTAPPSPSAVPASPNATQLAISPDGGAIIYRAEVGGVTGLYVRHADRLEGELLFGSPRGLGGFFVSPGGAWVGFSTVEDRTYKKVPITGGPAITLCPSPSAPRGASWAPDDTIIFARAGVGLGLFRVSAAGGEPQILTTPEAPEAHYWPALIPGRQAVLFTIVQENLAGEPGRIAVLDLETGEQRVLIQGGSHARYVPSGHLVYSFEDTVRAVAFDADTLDVLGDPVPVLDGVATTNDGGAHLAISDNGTLVYRQGGGTAPARSLVWVDREGNEESVAAEPRPYRAVQLSRWSGGGPPSGGPGQHGPGDL